MWLHAYHVVIENWATNLVQLISPLDHHQRPRRGEHVRDPALWGISRCCSRVRPSTTSAAAHSTRRWEPCTVRFAWCAMTASPSTREIAPFTLSEPFGLN